MKPDLELLTILEVCKLLKFSRKTIYKFINTGELKSINISSGKKKTYRIAKTEVKRWIDQKTYLANPHIEYVKLDKRWSIQ